MPRRTILTAILVLGLATAPARAGAGYVFEGGSAGERQEARAALGASAFDWSLVPARVTIHIVRGLAGSYSTPGQIWLDADLLDSGRFAWGTVQMEYAHQVHFFLLDDQARVELVRRLGGEAWCYETPTRDPGANACERFAAMLAWSYWPSPDNAMRPSGPADWSATVSPAAFRALLGRILARTPPA
jgi:hypothetical protein